MKIAQVVAAFPPRLGGMGSVADNESQELRKRGHEVTVFTLKYNHTSSESCSDGSIVLLCPLLRLGDAGVVPQLIWRLRGFDVIHLHYPFYGGAEWAALASRVWGIPLVITVHMEAATTGLVKQVVQEIYDRLMSAVIISQAAHVIGVDRTHFLSTSISAHVAEKKWTVIPNGVDAAIFKPEPVNWEQFPFPELKDKKIILFVGNLIPFKRLDLLIRAFSKIHEVEPDARLLVVGSGYAAAEYRALVETEGLAGLVIFAGRLEDSRVLNQYYNAAACTVIPADRGESFSLVLSESLSAGCPVVVSSIPGLAERVRDGVDGLLFQAGDQIDLADKLKSILQLSPDKHSAFGSAGRTRMIIDFSWEAHIAKLEQVYYSVSDKQVLS